MWGWVLPLIDKKMLYSLALSKKLSLMHGDFLTYQDVLHVVRDLLGSPRSFLYLHIIYLKKKYIESYNHLDILHEARDINYGPRLKSLF